MDISRFFTPDTKSYKDLEKHFSSSKENGCQPRILYPPKLTFRFDTKIKSFHDKQKLKEFTKRKPALRNTLSKIFH